MMGVFRLLTRANRRDTFVYAFNFRVANRELAALLYTAPLLAGNVRLDPHGALAIPRRRLQAGDRPRGYFTGLRRVKMDFAMPRCEQHEKEPLKPDTRALLDILQLTAKQQALDDESRDGAS